MSILGQCVQRALAIRGKKVVAGEKQRRKENNSKT